MTVHPSEKEFRAELVVPNLGCCNVEGTWEANANFNTLCFEELAESQDPISLSDGSSSPGSHGSWVGYYYFPQKHMAENSTHFLSNHISKVVSWEMS